MKPSLIFLYSAVLEEVLLTWPELYPYSQQKGSSKVLRSVIKGLKDWVQSLLVHYLFILVVDDFSRLMVKQARWVLDLLLLGSVSGSGGRMRFSFSLVFWNNDDEMLCFRLQSDGLDGIRNTVVDIGCNLYSCTPHLCTFPSNPSIQTDTVSHFLVL